MTCNGHSFSFKISLGRIYGLQTLDANKCLTGDLHFIKEFEKGAKNLPFCIDSKKISQLFLEFQGEKVIWLNRQISWKGASRMPL